MIELKAPIVGIPRPTEKRFAVERARLAVLIEGLEACQICLNVHLEIQAQGRHYKLYSLHMQQWARHHARRRSGRTARPIM